MTFLRRLLLPLLAFMLTAPLFAEESMEPLDPDQAYQFSARAVDAGMLEVVWKIADNYYMYREKIHFKAEPASIKLGEPQFPQGKLKDDEFFGRVETYRGELRVRVPVTAPGDVSSITLKATSQGCWDQGVCYPPVPQETVINLADAGKAGTPAATASPAADSPASAESDGDESSKIANLLRHGSFWVVIISFFGFGLLLSLTPCVFPMVPILSGIIVNHGHAVTHKRAFALSLSYVLGMAVTYAAVGVAAGFSGTLLSNALQNPWVLGAFALVFVILSLSMFGFYELQLPSALQSRLSETANRQGGSFGAIAMMGALSALIVGPCVAAPLAGALLYIAQTRDALLGGVALFAMALGMGAPLILVGVFSRSLLPKAGPWMEAVKKFFGVLMLATALWLVSPVAPGWLVMFGWAALLIMPAIYLHALDALPAHATGWHRFWKGIGVLMLVGGVTMLIGILGGARDPLQPLSFLKSAAASAGPAAGESVRFERIRSLAELDARLAKADKPVMLDFYADWCVSCKELEKFTFPDPAVSKALQGFIVLQADVTNNTDEDKALLKRFQLFGPPGIIFFDRAGKEIPGQRIIGYQPANTFLTSLERIRQ